MGQDVAARVFTRADRQRYREKVRATSTSSRGCWPTTLRRRAPLGRPGDRAQPDRRRRATRDGQRGGARGDRRPRLPDRARAVQRRDQHPAAAARRRRCSPSSRRRSARSLNHAEERAAHGRRAHDDHRDPADARRRAPQRRQRCSANPRYALLNEQIFAARGEDLRDRHRRAWSGCRPTPTRSRPRRRAPACSCTSRSTPTRSPRYWNAAQAIAGVQVAVGANSPFFFGTRAVARDPHRALRAGHRHPARGAQGPGRAAARVVRRALDHVDLRPLRGERALLPGAAADVRGRGPVDGARRAAARPSLRELRLHNGTIYRWNRPVYDVADGGRTCASRTACCPPGPTVVDILANAAFYYGLVRVLAEDERPVWTQMSFSAAEDNFHAGARDGIDARVYWPGVGRGPGRPSSCCAGCCRWPTRASSAGASTPPTATGCSASSSSAASRSRNGATWQARHASTALEEAGGVERARGAARDDACATAS